MWTMSFEFELRDAERFDRLQRLFYALAEAKEKGTLAADGSRWFNYFSEAELAHFWWPTQAEVQEHARLWKSLSSEARRTAPQLVHPWDFESWLEALSTGEYELSSLEQLDGRHGRLAFLTWSYPYGGSGALRFLLTVFGARIVREEV